MDNNLSYTSHAYEFSKKLEEIKNDLDNTFNIATRTEAIEICSRMRLHNARPDTISTLINDELDIFRLVSSLKFYKKYFQVDGIVVPISDYFKATDKIPNDFAFDNAKLNNQIIEIYENCAHKLPTVEQFDETFMTALNDLCGKYYSSADHMNRLVKNLINEYLKEKDAVNVYNMTSDSTRLLILKHFINVFGYIKINKTIDLSSLKDLIPEGGIEDLDDTVFNYMGGRTQSSNPDEADDGSSPDSAEAPDAKEIADRINVLSKLICTVRHKASTALMTPALCRDVCEIFENTITDIYSFEKDSEEQLLSSAAKNGTAVYLSDCFKLPHTDISLLWVKDVFNADTGKWMSFVKDIRKRASFRRRTHDEYTVEARLFVLLSEYADKIEINSLSKANISLLGEAFNKKKKGLTTLADAIDRSKVTYRSLAGLNDFENTDAIEKVVASWEKKALPACAAQLKLPSKDAYEAVAAEYTNKVWTAYKNLALSKNDDLSLDTSSPAMKRIVPKNYHPLVRLLAALKVVDDSSVKEAISNIYSGKIDHTKYNLLTDDVVSQMADLADEFEAGIIKSNGLNALYDDALYEIMCTKYNNDSKSNTGNTTTALSKDLYSLLDLDNTAYPILKIVNDLADARFSKRGKSREYLYVFAIAFGMTFLNKSTDGKAVNKYKDVQKNLFFDYYADNIKNVTEKGEDVWLQKIDGYGVNMKNFAELAFLWYLDRCDLSPLDKLQKSYDTIEYCKKFGHSSDYFDNPKNNVPSNDANTKVYFDNYNRLKPGENPDQVIRDYLVNNLPCRGNESITSINDEARSAHGVIKDMITSISAHYKELESRLIKSNKILEDLKDFFQSLNDSHITDDPDHDTVGWTLMHERKYLRDNHCKSCPHSHPYPFPFCTEYYNKKCGNEYNKETRTINKETLFPTYAKEFFGIPTKKYDDMYKTYNALLNAEENVDYDSENVDYDSDNDDLDAALSKLYKGMDLENMLDNIKLLVAGRFSRSFYSLGNLCKVSQHELKSKFDMVGSRLEAALHAIRGGDDFHPSRSLLISLYCIDVILGNQDFRAAYDSIPDETTDIHTMGSDDVDAKISVNFKDYYNYFCNVGIGAGLRRLKVTSKEDHVSSTGVNSYLEKAGYQKISSKNLLDMILIFTAYKDNLNNLYVPPSTAVQNYVIKVRAHLKKLKKKSSV